MNPRNFFEINERLLGYDPITGECSYKSYVFNWKPPKPLEFAAKLPESPKVNIYCKPKYLSGKKNKKNNPLAKALAGKSQRDLFRRSLPNELQYIDEFDPYEHLAYDYKQIHFNVDWGHVNEGTVHTGTVVGAKDGKFVVYIDTWQQREYQREVKDGYKFDLELKDVYIFNPRYKTHRHQRMFEVARAVKGFRNSLRRRKAMFTTSFGTHYFDKCGNFRKI